MIVVDSNILIHCLVLSDRTEDCKALKKADPNWVVPALWRYEFANALKTLCKAGRMRDDDATSIMALASETYRPCERDVPLTAVLNAAIVHDISAYDASFLALAQSMNLKLISEDSALVKKSHGWAKPLPRN